jgi:hypothetical protein
MKINLDPPFVIMTGFSNYKEHFKGIPVLKKPTSLQVLMETFEDQLFVQVNRKFKSIFLFGSQNSSKT